MRRSEGFSIIELLMTVCVYGLLLAVAMPHIQNFRLMNGLSSGQQAVAATMLRARWLAINRGGQHTVTLSGNNVLQIRQGNATSTVVSTSNLSNYGVTVDSFSAFAFDVRGFLPSTQTLTVRQATLPATKTVTVGMYGKVLTQ